MIDATENIRRALMQRINAENTSRESLEKRYGQVWDTEELKTNFAVIRFAAPLVIVQNRSTGERGSLFFQHDPRFYFSYERDES